MAQGRVLPAHRPQYNAAVQQAYIRRWFTMLRVGRELALGYFCTVTPP